MKKFKNQTFTPVYHSLLRQPNLTDADKITISCILAWAENDKDCYMGNDYLGQLMLLIISFYKGITTPTTRCWTPACC